MHQEIEKLIKYAVADGKLTEKERALIMRKAESLGEDLEEVKMIIDGEIALMSGEQNNKQLNYNISNKAGNILKCPACGASVKSFQIECEDCGHEFQNTKIEGYLEDFKKIIEKVISEKHTLYKYKVNNIEP